MIMVDIPGKLGVDSKIYFYKIYSPFATKGPRRNNFHILGAWIWAIFVRSGGGKTGGIASSFEDFATPGAGEDGLKPGWIKGEIISARTLRENRMCFFIAGVQPKTRILNNAPQRCPRCGLYQAYTQQVDHYISLFFLIT
jgi:hypothetical protein